MTKYSQDFKHTVVQAYLAGIGGYNTISHNFSVTHSLIEKWVEQYQKHGWDGLAVQSSRTIFSIEFKMNAVQMILEGMSFQEARRQLSLSDRSLLYRWLQQYQEHGIEGLKPKPKGRQKHMAKAKSDKIKPNKADQDKTQKELLEELEYLRTENAFLKKLRALRLEQEAKETAEQQKW